MVGEACAIAAANGYGLNPEQTKTIRSRLTRTDSILVSSLYRDLHKGAAVEADPILGDLLRRGAEHEVAEPLLGTAYTLTKVYEAKRVS